MDQPIPLLWQLFDSISQSRSLFKAYWLLDLRQFFLAPLNDLCGELFPLLVVQHVEIIPDMHMGNLYAAPNVTGLQSSREFHLFRRKALDGFS